MIRTAFTLVTGLASASLLFIATPAMACGADCDCPHKAEAQKADAKKADTKAKGQDAAKAKAAEPAKAKGTEDKAPAPKQGSNILAPVDQILSATCNCGGPGDCTCKKGECKCKKCSKHHHGVQKTQLLEPLNGSQNSPAVPQNARHDATAGVFI